MTKRSNKKNPFFRDKAKKEKDLRKSQKEADEHFETIMAPYNDLVDHLEKIDEEFKKKDLSLEEIYTRQHIIEEVIVGSVLRLSLLIANLSGFEVIPEDE